MTFWSENVLISDAYPIYPAKEYKRKWLKHCAIAYKKYTERDARYTAVTTAKCPGIRKICETGYILQSWCDIVITTNADGTYQVDVPKDLPELIKDSPQSSKLVTSFDMRYSPVRIPTGDNFNSILKFWTPYTFDVKEGYSLMVLPIPYDDDPPFSACPGIAMNFEIGFNIHVYWHVKEGRTFIPAGTPLCQLIPTKIVDDPIKVKEYTPEVKKKIEKIIFNIKSTFKNSGSNW